jgi:hypothetical protein
MARRRDRGDRQFFVDGEMRDPTEIQGLPTSEEGRCLLCGHITTEDPLSILERKREIHILLRRLGIDPDGDDSDISLELLRHVARKLN